MPEPIKGIKIGDTVYNIDYNSLENKPLPSVSASDNGKFVRVNSSGNYEVATIDNAEGSSF